MLRQERVRKCAEMMRDEGRAMTGMLREYSRERVGKGWRKRVSYKDQERGTLE